MEGVDDEMRERRGRRVGGRLAGTREEVIDVAGAHLHGSLMPRSRVLGGGGGMRNEQVKGRGTYRMPRKGD